MDRRPQVALAIGAGYLLGRTRKMRLAMMVGAAAATGSVDWPRRLLQQGTDKLASSPELSKLSDGVRGQLLTATKNAALATATNRIDSLTTRLQGTAQGEPAQQSDAADDEEGAPEPAEGESKEEEPKDESEEESEEEPKDESEEETEEQPERQPRSQAKKKSASTKRAPVRRAKK